MGKRIYWVLLGLVTLLGVASMIYYGVQPRPIEKISISRFETPVVLANSILLRLRQEIHESPVLFLGVEPDHPEDFQVWKEFLSHNQEPGYAYDVVVMDELLQSSEIPGVQKLSTKDEFETLVDGIDHALKAGKRVAVIVPTIYSVQMIPSNLVQNYKTRTKTTPLSLSLTDFPRRRDLEKDITHRCIVEGVDTTGLGPFGCLVLQTARANYRKRFQSGDWVGLLDQIGLKDYLVLYTQEK